MAIIFLTVRGSRHGGIDGYRRCTGVIFNTRAIVGCMCVQCGVGLRGKHSFVAGLLFSTRIVGGVAVCGGVCLRFYVRGYYF